MVIFNSASSTSTLLHRDGGSKTRNNLQTEPQPPQVEERPPADEDERYLVRRSAS